MVKTDNFFSMFQQVFITLKEGFDALLDLVDPEKLPGEQRQQKDNEYVPYEREPFYKEIHPPNGHQAYKRQQWSEIPRFFNCSQAEQGYDGKTQENTE